MTKELLPGLLAVEVPEGATSIKIGGHCKQCTWAGIWHCAHADTCGNSLDAIKIYKDTDFIESIGLDEQSGTWSILGLGTADKITPEEWGTIYPEMYRILRPGEFKVFVKLELLEHGLNPSTTVLITNPPQGTK